MKLLLRTSLFGLLAAGLVWRASAADSAVLARVGDTDIKVDDVRPFLQKLDARQQAALARDPALLSQFVRTIVVQQLLLKQAEADHWDQQPVVKEQLDRVRDSALAESYLESVSKAPESYPSAAELQAAYDANKDAILVPRQLRLAQIYIALPKDAGKDAADKAQARVASVQENLKQSDFAEVASSRSDEQASAARGGEIGWLTEAQIQPELRAQVAGLAKNATSAPIRLNDGWHIIKVLDVKEAYTPSLDDIRSQLTQQLRAARARANSEAYLAKLLQQNQVAINEIALSQILPKVGK